MKQTTGSDRHVFSDWRFLIDQAENGTPGVGGHTVATALLQVLVTCGDWLVLPCFIYMLESENPLWCVPIILTAVLVLLRFALTYEQGVFARSRDRFRTRGSTRLAEKALSLPYADTVDAANRQAWSCASHAIGRHIEAPIPHIWKTVSALLAYALTAVVYSAVLCRYHVGLWGVAVITAVLGALVHRFVSDRGVRESEGEALCDTALTYVSDTAESLRFSKDIRVFSLAPWLKAMYDSGFRAVQELSRRRAKMYALYNVAEALLILLSNGLAYLFLIYDALYAALPVSALCLYLAAVGGLTLVIRGLAEDAQTLQAEHAQLTVYRRFLEQPYGIADGNTVPSRGAAHTLEVRDITFTHRGASEPTFERLSFTWHPGEKLAIVLDGNGRSTLAKLLCGLYDPDEGAILLDGTEVRKLSRRAYYALFSAVLQDRCYPDMTVAEFITCAPGAFDEARLQDSLLQAGAAEMTAALPHGVHTVIGRTASDDGVELSGGQMQRLLLARALYKDGDLFVFDEPTAALDPLAEQALYRDYDRLTRSKGAVFLSHRLAATRFCDRILVLKHGAVCEEGTHEELLKRGGDYARLFAFQSRYYREGRDPS